MRGWVGLDGRPWGEMGSCSSKMGAQETGRGRPSRPTPPLPTALAPTACDGLVLSLMDIGGPSWSPVGEDVIEFCQRLVVWYIL